MLKSIVGGQTTRKKNKLHQKSFHNSYEGCTTPWHQIVQATESFNVASNIGGYSVWKWVPTDIRQEILVFSKTFRLTLGITQFYTQRVPGFFRVGKAAGAWCEPLTSPPSPICHPGVDRENFFLPALHLLHVTFLVPQVLRWILECWTHGLNSSFIIATFMTSRRMRWVEFAARGENKWMRTFSLEYNRRLVRRSQR